LNFDLIIEISNDKFKPVNDQVIAKTLGPASRDLCNSCARCYPECSKDTSAYVIRHRYRYQQKPAIYQKVGSSIQGIIRNAVINNAAD